MSESINHIVLSTGLDKLESKKIRSVNPPNRHNIISWSTQRFPSRIETELYAGGKAGNEDFSSWSMHMASMGLNLQCHGAGTRSGVRTCVGGAWPILVTAPTSNGRGESLLCSGTWEKAKNPTVMKLSLLSCSVAKKFPLCLTWSRSLSLYMPQFLNSKCHCWL